MELTTHAPWGHIMRVYDKETLWQVGRKDEDFDFALNTKATYLLTTLIGRMKQLNEFTYPQYISLWDVNSNKPRHKIICDTSYNFV